MLIHNNDDIQFVTEFPCFLVHPVVFISEIVNTLNIDHKTLKKNEVTYPLQSAFSCITSSHNS